MSGAGQIRDLVESSVAEATKDLKSRVMELEARVTAVENDTQSSSGSTTVRAGTAAAKGRALK